MPDQKSKLTLAKINKADLAKGRHVLIVESPESRRAVSLNVSVFSIGRHPNNDLVIGDPLASRHHATVAWMRYTEGSNKTDYAYWIIDGKGKKKKSRNGILVNGDKKNLHRLVSGDIIRIGTGIKISYSYIAYSTDSSQFLNYCSAERTEYKPIFSDRRSYKDTVVLEDSIVNNNFSNDDGEVEETILKE